jgi:hypothetical protein
MKTNPMAQYVPVLNHFTRHLKDLCLTSPVEVRLADDSVVSVIWNEPNEDTRGGFRTENWGRLWRLDGTSVTSKDFDILNVVADESVDESEEDEPEDIRPNLGDIVRILEHDAAGDIPEGSVGTVVLDNNDYDGSVLVRFDDWDGGHSGYPDYRFATPETQFSHWWVFNEYLAVVCSADEGKSDE